MTTADRSHRGTIRVESAEVLAHQAHADGQYTITLGAPRVVERAQPGQFVHLSCGAALPMRRPMSIMRVDKVKGSLDVLYKVHGEGTALLSSQRPGTELSVLGPIGRPFRLDGYRPVALLIGGGVGIPPMVYLAGHLAQRAPEVRTLAVLGSEIRFPFTPRPSTILTPGLPAEVTATMPFFEDLAIPCRLSSRSGFPGCYEGFVTELADLWIDRLTGPDSHAPEDIEIFACGPTPMLAAVQRLAAARGVAAQVSLEEYMACAVGGCAGCTVPVRTDAGLRMQRVCVDGPVFEATRVVFPEPTP